MGQPYSHVRGSAAPLSTPTAQSTAPPLLNLPVELLLAITDHLSLTPESIIALSLACKALSAILQNDVAKLTTHGSNLKWKGKFLNLLERDLSDSLFYCSICLQLDRFEANGRIKHSRPFATILTQLSRQLFCPGTSDLQLSFAHARLMMNRHLYGPPVGLPLSSLTLGNTKANCDGFAWTYTTSRALLARQYLSAPIIDDELFLRITHVFEGTETGLREAIDRLGGTYRICTHVRPAATDGYGHRNGMRRVAALTDPEEEGGQERWFGLWLAGRPSVFRTCRDVLQSCTACLTDFTTSVERGEVREVFALPQIGIEPDVGPVVGGRRVVITAYHGVGGCRDAEDWNWASIVGENTGPGEDFSAALGGRDMVAFPAGWVKQSWQAEAHQEDGPADLFTWHGAVTDVRDLRMTRKCHKQSKGDLDSEAVVAGQP
ncbi:hypothetical protein GE09DRAFT_355165 [Coniochaeta sp. 2T2.1]|nr:hypothetical protein GE09DRAFT_355165 [Coniochaeta sp. 2T2.1]